MDRIRLNLRIEGEIRYRSIANGLQDFQSVTNPFTFGSVKSPRIESDQSVLQINGFFVHPYYEEISALCFYPQKIKLMTFWQKD